MMDIFNISNLEIKSIVKVLNKSTGSQFIQYGKYLDYFQLIYVSSGEATINFNDTTIVNKPGIIVFLPKGPCSNYQAKIHKDELCIAIFFCADFSMFPPLASHNFLKNAKLSSMFEKLYQVWLRKETGYYNKCKSIFYSILFEMELSITKYIPSSKGAKIDNAVDYIHAHYTESNFPYQILHSLCGISYTYFKKLFWERFCLTPSDYVKKLKIQRACELLITDKFSVTQVSDACGFSDVCYFSKVFKNEVGTPPSTFRKLQNKDTEAH